MADKIASNLLIGSGTKNIKLVDVVLFSDKKSLVETKDSLYRGKGFQLNYEQPEIKNETDVVVNEMDNILGNKSSMTSLNILKTVSATASTPASVTVKKELITMSGFGEVENNSSTLAPVYTPTPIKPAKALNVQSGEVNSDNNGNQTADGNKDGNNLIRLSVKDLSDEERKKLRAKRFNIIVPESSQNANRTITKAAPNVVYETTSNDSQTNHPTPTYNILKKRAQRFGENVSTVMKSLDYKEKLLKRKLKFLESVTNLKELEQKKRRAERFRMI